MMIDGIDYPLIQDFCSKPMPPDVDTWLLVAVWFDGEPELWWVEGSVDGMTQLISHYEEEWGKEGVQEWCWKDHVSLIQDFTHKATERITKVSPGVFEEEPVAD